MSPPPKMKDKPFGDFEWRVDERTGDQLRKVREGEVRLFSLLPFEILQYITPTTCHVSRPYRAT